METREKTRRQWCGETNDFNRTRDHRRSSSGDERKSFQVNRKCL